MDYKITVSDEQVSRIEKGFAGQYNYSETIKDSEGKDIQNPQSKADFMIEQCKAFIKESVLAYESKMAALAAKAASEHDPIL